MDISFGHDQLWVADKDGRLQLYDASLGQFEHILASLWKLRTVFRNAEIYPFERHLNPLDFYSVTLLS